MINRKWYYVILQSRAITPARKTLVESQIDSSRDNDFIIIKTIYIYIKRNSSNSETDKVHENNKNMKCVLTKT